VLLDNARALCMLVSSLNLSYSPSPFYIDFEIASPCYFSWAGCACNLKFL
jgi:hypothetical protein